MGKKKNKMKYLDGLFWENTEDQKEAMKRGTSEASLRMLGLSGDSDDYDTVDDNEMELMSILTGRPTESTKKKKKVNKETDDTGYRQDYTYSAEERIRDYQRVYGQSDDELVNSLMGDDHHEVPAQNAKPESNEFENANEDVDSEIISGVKLISDDFLLEKLGKIKIEDPYVSTSIDVAYAKNTVLKANTVPEDSDAYGSLFISIVRYIVTCTTPFLVVKRDGFNHFMEHFSVKYINGTKYLFFLHGEYVVCYYMPESFMASLGDLIENKLDLADDESMSFMIGMALAAGTVHNAFHINDTAYLEAIYESQDEDYVRDTLQTVLNDDGTELFTDDELAAQNYVNAYPEVLQSSLIEELDEFQNSVREQMLNMMEDIDDDDEEDEDEEEDDDFDFGMLQSDTETFPKIDPTTVARSSSDDTSSKLTIGDPYPSAPSESAVTTPNVDITPVKNDPEPSYATSDNANVKAETGVKYESPKIYNKPEESKPKSTDGCPSGSMILPVIRKS